MDYYGVSSPSFIFESDEDLNTERDFRREFERVRDKFQESNYYDFNKEIRSNFNKEIRSNFEKSQNFYSDNINNIFSMEKKDTDIDGFGCQNVNCNNREARFGTTYLPFCNENKKCMKKNIEYLLLENTKLKVFAQNSYEEYGVIAMDIDDKPSPKRKREDSLKKSTEPNPKRLFL